MLRFYSLAVVITFFVTVNFYLIVKLLLVSPQESVVVDNRITIEDVESGGVDEVGLSVLGGDHTVSEDGSVHFEGSAVLTNSQGAPAPKAVVTLQLVAPGTVFIDQFTADDSGVAEVVFDWVGTGSYRIEVLDIVGEGFEYASHLNEVRVITGRAIYEAPVDGTGITSE